MNIRPSNRHVTLVVSTSLVLMACGDDSTGNPNATVGSTAVASIAPPQNATDTMRSRGDTLLIAAIARILRAKVVANTAITLSTSAPDVATVQATSDDATISVVGDGEATITSASRNILATTTVHVPRRISTVDLVLQIQC